MEETYLGFWDVKGVWRGCKEGLYYRAYVVMWGENRESNWEGLGGCL